MPTSSFESKSTQPYAVFKSLEAQKVFKHLPEVRENTVKQKQFYQNNLGRGCSVGLFFTPSLSTNLIF